MRVLQKMESIGWFKTCEIDRDYKELAHWLWRLTISGIYRVSWQAQDPGERTV